MRLPEHIPSFTVRKSFHRLPSSATERCSCGPLRGQWWPYTEIQLSYSEALRSLRARFGATARFRTYGQPGSPGWAATVGAGKDTRILAHCSGPQADYALLYWRAMRGGV